MEVMQVLRPQTVPECRLFLIESNGIVGRGLLNNLPDRWLQGGQLGECRYRNTQRGRQLPKERHGESNIRTALQTNMRAEVDLARKPEIARAAIPARQMARSAEIARVKSAVFIACIMAFFPFFRNSLRLWIFLARFFARDVRVVCCRERHCPPCQAPGPPPIRRRTGQ